MLALAYPALNNVSRKNAAKIALAAKKFGSRTLLAKHSASRKVRLPNFCSDHNERK
jgi:hypothetical protein